MWISSRCWLGAILALAVLDHTVAQDPRLFLTVKSSNLATLTLADVESAHVVVTDLMISPEGVPFPMFSGDMDQAYFKRLQKDRPGVKFLASFGGTAVPPELFSHLTASEASLATFVRELIQFATQNGFHGFDIAWLYPTQADKENYSKLLQVLRVACDQYKLLLTVTAPSNPAVIGKNYPVDVLATAAHYVILSTNEFRKLKKTSLIAPLYSINAGSSNSVDFHVNAWKLAGLSSERIIIVVQTSSLTYKLHQPRGEHQLGTSAIRLKVRPFFKICHRLYSGSLEIFEERARCPYAFRESNWYSYENKQSIREKVEYVLGQRLGGVAVAYYDEDDPTNLCGDGAYPVTNTVMSFLQHGMEEEEVAASSESFQFDVEEEGESGDSYEYAATLRVVDGNSRHEEICRSCDADFGSEVEVAEKKLRQAPTYGKHTCHSCGQIVHEPTPPPCPCHDNLHGNDEGDVYYKHANVPVNIEYNPTDTLTDIDDDPSVILVDSDKAFALHNKSSADAQEDDGILFSEKAGPTTYEDEKIFTEPQLPIVFQKVPPEANYDPKRSRLGFIAIASSDEPKPSGCTDCMSQAAPSSCGCEARTVECPSCNSCSPCCAGCASQCSSCDSCCGYCGCSSSGACLTCKSQVPPKTTTSNSVPPPQDQVEQSFDIAELYSNTDSLPNRAQVQRSVNYELPVNPTCPHDGVFADPSDPRYYYLCRQGLPMCDENRFSCAEGFLFDPAQEKCVPESSWSQ